MIFLPLFGLVMFGFTMLSVNNLDPILILTIQETLRMAFPEGVPGEVAAQGVVDLTDEDDEVKQEVLLDVKNEEE